MKRIKVKDQGYLSQRASPKLSGSKKIKLASKEIENFLINVFKDMDKKMLQAISKFCKLKKIGKTLIISKSELQNKKFRFLNKYYCLVKENIGFAFVETNHRKIIVELFYPGSIVDVGIFEVLPEASINLPRNTKLVLIPMKFLEYPEMENILKKYKADLENQKKRECLIEIANSKSLDSLNKLLYFIYKYWLMFKGRRLNTEAIPLPNKKVISYITGNSHESVIRNFKKLEKMNYLALEGNGIKINPQRFEQWLKNLKIII